MEKGLQDPAIEGQDRKAKSKMKKYADAKAYVKPSTIQEGDGNAVYHFLFANEGMSTITLFLRTCSEYIPKVLHFVSESKWREIFPISQKIF